MMNATLRLDGRLERRELDGAQSIRRMLDDRKLEMGIGRGVAVPGKMFAAGRHARALQLFDDHAAELRHDFGLLAERAVADDRIFRVRVDVEHRRVVERDADGRQLRRKRLRQISAPARDRRCGPSTAMGGHSVKGERRRATRPPS